MGVLREEKTDSAAMKIKNVGKKYEMTVYTNKNRCQGGKRVRLNSDLGLD